MTTVNRKHDAETVPTGGTATASHYIRMELRPHREESPSKYSLLLINGQWASTPHVAFGGRPRDQMVPTPIVFARRPMVLPPVRQHGCEVRFVERVLSQLGPTVMAAAMVAAGLTSGASNAEGPSRPGWRLADGDALFRVVRQEKRQVTSVRSAAREIERLGTADRRRHIPLPATRSCFNSRD